MFKHLKALMCILLLAAAASVAQAQTFALKTNLLYDATATVNLGGELRVAPKWTIDLSGNLNAWAIKNHRWKHWLVQPEARYWCCNTWSGHFVGAHLLGGQYNVGGLTHARGSLLGIPFHQMKDHRYQGWYAGAGIAYGYTWILARHWSIEAEIGLGYIYTRYDVFPCAKCGTKIANDRPHHYVGPTKAAVNIIYNF